MTILVEWRRRPNDDRENDWHCCRNCQSWPGNDDIPQPESRWVEDGYKPKGEMCDFCARSIKAGECKRNTKLKA